MAFNFKKGGDTLATESKQAAFNKTHYLDLKKDGDKTVLRMITDHDEWITVKQHMGIPTKGKPANAKTWPSAMPAVCRLSKDGDDQPFFPDCWVCENVVGKVTSQYGSLIKAPTARGWALAVEREEVFENGVRKGFKDKVREVAITDKDGKDTGQVREEKAVVIINLSQANFFGSLKSFASTYGTVLDRDYYVTREGVGTDTVYRIVPADPTSLDLRDEEVLKKRYGKTKAEFFEDLAEIVGEHMSDEYYARFFDPTKTVAESGTNGATAATAAAAPPSNEVSDEKLAALANRVTQYGATSAPAPAAAAPADDDVDTVAVGAGAQELD